MAACVWTTFSIWQLWDLKKTTKKKTHATIHQRYLYKLRSYKILAPKHLAALPLGVLDIWSRDISLLWVAVLMGHFLCDTPIYRRNFRKCKCWIHQCHPTTTRNNRHLPSYTQMGKKTKHGTHLLNIKELLCNGLHLKSYRVSESSPELWQRADV